MRGRKCMEGPCARCQGVAVESMGRKCMGKETEGRKIKVRGRPPPPPGGQEARGGAKGLCAGCQGATVEGVWAANK